VYGILELIAIHIISVYLLRTAFFSASLSPSLLKYIIYVVLIEISTHVCVRYLALI
jgi:hypothetical protein